jgi:hypothetical protein
MFPIKNKVTGAFYALMASLTTLVFAAAPAMAAPTTRCDAAKAVGPTADKLSGEMMGLGYRLGVPLAVALFAGLVFFALTRKAGGIWKALGTVVGVVVGLGFIVGLLTALVASPCG